jgi:pimeloyl-ACP methyl ester carboxylesterase
MKLSHNLERQIMNIVTSKDGTRITYSTVGDGPGLIIVPGALAVAEDFAALAHELSEHFTVHVVERRGRGESGPQGVDYSIEKECEDIKAVQSKTNATYIFGHSFGGFVAMEVARNNSIFKKIAVYEPGISIDGSINLNWIPRAEEELTRQRYHAAFITFTRGLNPQSARAPRPLLSFIVRMVIKKKEREQKYRLLSGTIREHQEEGRLNNTYPHYSEINADVLLMRGGKGVMPDNAAEELLSVLLHGHEVVFPKLDHLAPESRPQQIAREIIAFFSQDKI